MRLYLHNVTPRPHIQWNIDCSVGKGGQNSNREDVMYLQWYYSLAAKNAKTAEDRRLIYARVEITGMCSGKDGDPLVDSIVAHQRGIAHPVVDGRCSVAVGDGRIGGSAFFVLRIGARLADMYPRLWPRLDLIPDCPPKIAEVVISSIPRLQGPS